MTERPLESEYSHLLEKVRPITELSRKERFEYIDEDRWIGYEKAKKIHDYLEDLLYRPKKIRPQSALIIGESNIGKTTITVEFVKKHHINVIEDPEIDKRAVQKPLLLINAPSSPDEKSFFIAILENFFAPHRPTHTKHQLRQQTIHLMKKFDTRMLIIDEIHNFLSGSASAQRDVMIMLKNLSNELQLSIVGVGTKDAVQILHTDPQHASRFDVISLPKWSLDIDFLKLLASFEKLLPLKNPSNLKEKQIATTLFEISSGNFGDLNKLLIACAKDAISSGEEKITYETIMRHKDIQPTKGQRNIRYIDI